MTVWLNGEEADTRGAETIAQLAGRYGLQPHTVLVEHNGIALHQREWAVQQLCDSDRIEFIRVVAGG